VSEANRNQGPPARRWPLILIAAPAAVAIWSGWVGLGGLCGFGPVHLLPGITDWTLNTAITLPVGVEAYAAYALGAWMAPGTPARARRFARWSALGALAYGMAGQVIYHLLAAAHATAAPWPVVVVVSCMPVAVLGLAAALTHLLRAAPAVEAARPVHETVLDRVPSSVLEAAEASMRATIAAGNPLSQNQLASRFSLTRGQATAIRDAVIAPDVPAGVIPPGAAPAGTHLNGHGAHG
jgi:hypothetical protein